MPGVFLDDVRGAWGKSGRQEPPPCHLRGFSGSSVKIAVLEKKALHASEPGRPDLQRLRSGWWTRVAGVDPSRFVFLDEIGAHTALTRRYGRAPRGERLVDRVPQGHWRTTTLIAAIRHDGVAASLVFEGATEEAAFLTFVKQVLIPALRPGEMVVLDRLSVPRVGAVARALRKAGAGVWYLPPYAPDFNPIEQVWAKVKGLLRQAEARTTETLWEALGQALHAVTAQDCRGCFEHCGYHATPMCNAL